MSALAVVPAILAAVLAAAAGLIWLERRLLGLLQERLGPNRVGPLGLLQPAADVLKLLTKEDWIPPFADRPLFVLAPAIAVASTLLAFAVVPIGPGLGIVDLDVGLLFFLGVSSLGAYSLVLAGWSSGSPYALLGGMRAAAQVISYEVFMGLALGGVVILAGSFDLRAIVEAQQHLWFVVPQAAGFVVFVLAILAETHRLPFDLPEADAELVAGFHAEYSGMKFAMFFVAEYVGLLLGAALCTVLFLGGWHGPWLPPVVWFAVKCLLMLVIFVLARAALPRPRFDQLMAMGWKALLPLSLANLAITGAILVARGAP